MAKLGQAVGPKPTDEPSTKRLRMDASASGNPESAREPGSAAAEQAEPEAGHNDHEEEDEEKEIGRLKEEQAKRKKEEKVQQALRLILSNPRMNSCRPKAATAPSYWDTFTQQNFVCE